MKATKFQEHRFASIDDLSSLGLARNPNQNVVVLLVVQYGAAEMNVPDSQMGKPMIYHPKP